MLTQASWRANRRLSVGISARAPCRFRHHRAAPSKIFISRTAVADYPIIEAEPQGPGGILRSEDRPLAIKDNIATLKGFTTCASKILTDHQSPFEADVVAQLRKAKARPIGKTNLDEFGMGSHSVNSNFGRVKNHFPHEGRSAGGSSGGSAIAIAAGHANIGLGTDTGGSVRLPAAYTGTVGFKPSYGLISRWGVVPYANSLDTVGIIAAKTSTVLEAFKKASHHDPRDPTSLTKNCRQRLSEQALSLEKERRIKLEPGESDTDRELIFSNIRIGVPLEYNIAELDDSIRQAWDDALSILQSNGATIIPISLPNTRHALSAYYVLAPAEAASNLAKYDGVRYGFRSDGLWDGRGDVLYSETRGDGFGDEVKRRILLGSYTLSSEAIDNHFIQAQKVRRLVQQDFDRVFAASNPLRDTEQYDLSDMDESIVLGDKLGPSQVDFIVSPTAPTPPPLLEDIRKQTPVDSYMNDVFTVPASLAGIPAISIPFPCLRARHQIKPDEGFAGIQIMGQYSDDLRVISIAQKFEQLIGDLLDDIRQEKERVVRYYETLRSPKAGVSGKVARNPMIPEDTIHMRGVGNTISRKADTVTSEGSDGAHEEHQAIRALAPKLIKYSRTGDRHPTAKELQAELEQSLEASLSMWESSRELENAHPSTLGD